MYKSFGVFILLSAAGQRPHYRWAAATLPLGSGHITAGQRLHYRWAAVDNGLFSQLSVLCRDNDAKIHISKRTSAQSFCAEEKSLFSYEKKCFFFCLRRKTA